MVDQSVRQVIGNCVHAGLQGGFKFISVSVQQNVAIGGAEVLHVQQHPACLTVLSVCEAGTSSLVCWVSLDMDYHGSDVPKHGVGLRCVCICVDLDPEPGHHEGLQR